MKRILAYSLFVLMIVSSLGLSGPVSYAEAEAPAVYSIPYPENYPTAEDEEGALQKNAPSMPLGKPRERVGGRERKEVPAHREHRQIGAAVNGGEPRPKSDGGEEESQDKAHDDLGAKAQ